MGLFRKSKNTRHAHNNKNIPKYSIRREDGSELYISPVLDENGMQAYENFPNAYGLRILPKFNISSTNKRTGNIVGGEVVMDINPMLLNNPDYLNAVAHMLLSADRTEEKVFGEYYKYAGGFSFDKKRQNYR